MKKSTVEITIPVYNEEKELEKHITVLADYCKKNLSDYLWHITIADNASTDATRKIAEDIQRKEKNISYNHLGEKGRGRAVKKTWLASNADYCVYMDLDLSTDITHLPELIGSLRDKRYDISIGSRLAKGARVEGRTLLREITSRVLNYLFIRLVFQTHFTDAQCGFKAISRAAVKELLPFVEDNGWFFDGELLIVGEKSGYKIYEIPVHWIDNPGSTVRLLSTISEDISAMLRLFLKRPWRKLRRKNSP